MKTRIYFFGLMLATSLGYAGLPVITSPPKDLIVPPGSNAVFSVIADSAASFQWRFKGDDIPGATDSTLVVTSAQYTNSGYYSVLTKNAIGWAPSPLAYLSVVTNSGVLSFNNGYSNTARAYYEGVCGYLPHQGQPITNGVAQLLAGPAPDKIQAVGDTTPVSDGFFSDGVRYVPTAEPGATTYCRVDISFPNCSYPQSSSTIQLNLGETGLSTSALTNLQFPVYLGWRPSFYYYSTSTTKLTGETVTFTFSFFIAPSNVSNVQWRKDGNNLAGATNVTSSFDFTSTLTITNLQGSDAGVYDAVLTTTYLPAVSPKFYLSIQLTNGGGIFLNPRINGGNFLSDLEGMPGRNYAIQWSTNLSDWSDLATLSNITGTVTFTNSLDSEAERYYRAMLLP